MAIDYIGREGGWGTCPDCTGKVRLCEISKGVYIWRIPAHDDTCPQLHEVPC